MAKKFIDSGLFDDSWFMDLSLSAKVFWIYCITKCNHAGIIDLNEKLCQFQTGIKGLQTVIKELGNRIITLKNNYYFIPKYIEYQYPNFPNSKVRQQESAIKILEEFNLIDSTNLTLKKGLTNPYDSVSDNVNDNDNDSDDKKNKGICLMKNSGVTTDDIKQAFAKTNDLKNANHIHYFNAMLDWSESKGEMRKDWIATARTFARKDLDAGKLKLKDTIKTATNVAANDLPEDYGIPSPKAVSREQYLKQKAMNIAKQTT